MPSASASSAPRAPRGRRPNGASVSVASALLARDRPRPGHQAVPQERRRDPQVLRDHGRPVLLGDDPRAVGVGQEHRVEGRQQPRRRRRRPPPAAGRRGGRRARGRLVAQHDELVAQPLDDRPEPRQPRPRLHVGGRGGPERRRWWRTSGSRRPPGARSRAVLGQARTRPRAGTPSDRRWGPSRAAAASAPRSRGPARRRPGTAPRGRRAARRTGAGAPPGARGRRPAPRRRPAWRGAP